MLERGDHRRYVQNPRRSRPAQLEYSHASSIPPVAAAVLAVQRSDALLLFCGVVLVGALLAYDRRLDEPIRDRFREYSGREPDPHLSRDGVDKYLSGRHPDWESAQVKRVTEAVIKQRPDRHVMTSRTFLTTSICECQLSHIGYNFLPPTSSSNIYSIQASIPSVPGVAKTTIANLFAHAANLDYQRIQMTPDVLPADITGTHIYRENLGEFELQRGPVFSNLVLADEINRATPKTQTALLEAMQEGQVTIEGERSSSPIRSWSSPRRTPSSTRGRSISRRPSATASSSRSSRHPQLADERESSTGSTESDADRTLSRRSSLVQLRGRFESNTMNQRRPPSSLNSTTTD